MLFTNILFTTQKSINCFTTQFYNLTPTVKCEEVDLKTIKYSYLYFAALEIRKLTILKTQFENPSAQLFVFTNPYFVSFVPLDTVLKFKSLSLVNPQNSKILKEWQDPTLSIVESLCRLSNASEICEELKTALKEEGDKIQIKIKLTEKIKEFVFIEFTIKGEYVECDYCPFSTEKDSYLDYFPNEVQSLNGLLNFYCIFVNLLTLDADKTKIENILEGENIKRSTIIQSGRASHFFQDTKSFKNFPGLEFVGFNLSLNKSKLAEWISSEVYSEPMTLLLTATKSEPEINLNMFYALIEDVTHVEVCIKTSLKLLKDDKITKETVKYTTNNLIKIQKEDNSVTVILGRPTEDVGDTIKAKGGLSIEFMDVFTENKSTKITIDGVETTEEVTKLANGETTNGEFTLTSFTIKKDEFKGEKSNLYDALTKSGLVSITVHGKNKLIGTYALSINESGNHVGTYSDKLISIPFIKETTFFTKRVIIIAAVVSLIILVGIFAYFYTRRSK